MFKSLLIVVTVCFVSVNASAQIAGNTGIAPFKIRLVNGEGFTYAQLQQDRPVILVYFSTTCDHCKAFTEALVKRIDKLRESQVIMISNEHIRDVKAFDDRYKLSQHQNLKIGSEGNTLVVQKYYHVEHFPFVASFKKNGQVKKIIPWNLKPEEMAAEL